MIHWLKFIFLVFFLSCAPKKGNITLVPWTQGSTGPGGIVSSLQVTGTQLIIDGSNLQGTTSVSMASTTRSFTKTFNVIFASANQVIAEAVDATKIPVGVMLNLILDSASAQTSIPIEFELPPSSVSTPEIDNNAVTTPKLADKSVTLLKLADGPTVGTATQVMAWNPISRNWLYAPYMTGSGSAGVTAITLGEGMVGQVSAGLTGPVTVAVDVAVGGDPSETKIPFFNRDNEIELSFGTSGTANRPAKILLAKSAAPDQFFSIFNNGTEFKITLEDASPIDDLLIINQSGLVTIPGALMVSGKNVCLQDGTSCPVVSVPLTQVLAAPPLTASGTGIVTIGPGAVNTANNLVQLDSSGKLPGSITGIVRGPASSSSGTLAYFLDTTGSQLADSNLNFQNIPTMAASSSASNHPILSAGPDKTLISASYTIPSTACADGEILIANASGNLICASYQGGVTLFNGRSGVVTPTAGDYTATQIDNLPGFGITALNVQLAIDELQNNKLPIVGGTMTRPILMGPSGAVTNEIRFEELAGGGTNYVGFKAPDDIVSNIIWTLPAAAGASGTILTTNGSNILSWTTVGGASGIGDVVGPGIATIGAVPSFNNGTGTLLANSTKLVINLVTSNATATAGNLAQFDSTGKVISDSNINGADVPLWGPLPLGANRPILSSGSASKTLNSANYALPVTLCPIGYALISDGTDFICSFSAIGDVVSSGTATIDSIPTFSNTTGKTLQDSSFTINGNNLFGGNAVIGENGLGQACFSNYLNPSYITDYGFCQSSAGNTRLNSASGQPLDINIGGVPHLVVEDAITTVKNILAVEGVTVFNQGVTNSSTFPTTRGANGQVLSTDGLGTLSWKSVGIGVNNQTAAYTLVVGDCGNTVTINSAANVNLTVPALSIGCTVDIVQLGAGQVTVVGSGLTVQNAFNLFKTRTQYSLVTVKILTASLAILAGDIN